MAEPDTVENENGEGEGDKVPAQAELFAELKEHSKAADARVERLAAEIAASRQATATRSEPKIEATPQRIYTAEELDTWVTAGKITNAVALEYLSAAKAAQAEENAVKRAKEELRKELAAERSKSTVGEKIEAFKKAYPEIKDRNSSAFKEVKEAFAELVAEGKPDTEATELDALRAVFGRSPESRKTPRETTGERERTVEASGSSAGRTVKRGESNGANGFPSWVPERNAKFFSEGIKRGLYKNMKDPNLVTELQILKNRIDSKQGAA